MILVDTSVWIDHLHKPVGGLVELLGQSMVAHHPMVIGELALGSLRDRETVLSLLANLPRVPVATNSEVLAFVEAHALFARGLSLVDAHLLASATLAPGTVLWTRDKRLQIAAKDLGVEH